MAEPFRILLREGTAAEWTNANPVLGRGEAGVEIDTQKVKFGDGTTAWNAIPDGIDVNTAALAEDPQSELNRVLNATFATNEHVQTLAYGTNLDATDSTVATWVPDIATLTGQAIAANFAGISRTGAKAVGQGELLIDAAVHGVTGNDGVARTAEVQAAIDAASTVSFLSIQGRGVRLPPGRVVTDAPLIPRNGVTIEGNSRVGTHLWNDTTDLFAVGTRVRDATFKNLRMRTGASGGHVFNCDTEGIILSSFINCTFDTENPASSIWRQHGFGQTIDVLFDQCNLNQVAGSTVPAFDVNTAGTFFNSVTWRRSRVHGHNTSAVPFFHIENYSGNSYNCNLVWDQITGEQNGGGFIHTYAANGVWINQCPEWDYQGTYQDDIFKFASSAGLGSTNVTIVSSWRVGSEPLAAGKYDINVSDPANRNITIINPDFSDSNPASISPNNNPAAVTILGARLLDGAPSARTEYRAPVNVRPHSAGGALYVGQLNPAGHGLHVAMEDPAPTGRLAQYTVGTEANPRAGMDATGRQLFGTGTEALSPGVAVDKTLTLPPADAAHRGMIVLQSGADANGGDVLKVCRYGGAGVGYEWALLH